MSPLYARRVIQQELPFADFAQRRKTHPWLDAPRWPCSWIRLQRTSPQPFVVAYRLKFQLETARLFRVHVSGDERYEFFVNGERVGRGPTRAPRGRWHYESYELELPSGEHLFAARVHSLGKLAPWAQTSYGHGWLLAPEPEDLWDQIGTGRAAWEAKVLTGYQFTSPKAQLHKDLGCGAMLEVGESIPNFRWIEDWEPVETTFAGNNGVTLYFRDDEPLLHPTSLPSPRQEVYSHLKLRDAWSGAGEVPFPLQFADRFNTEHEQIWSRLLKGHIIEVAPHQKLRVLLDFENYVAAYPSLIFGGGGDAVVRLGWSEALVDEAGQKGDRSQVEGQRWYGLTDTFLPDGGEYSFFDTLWWRCGRYLLLEVETAAEPLQLHQLSLEETRYPLEVVAQWKCSQPKLETLFGICQRSLELCLHETYMDCPFYEQLQYLGDTRLQILLTYVLSGDDRPARQTLTAFASAQRNPTNWMPSNHPGRVGQCIPPFTLWWVAMLHDFGRWRGDQNFVRSLLPAARSVVELWLQNLDDNGLVATPEGWNFVDAVGHLLDAKEQFSGALNWHLVYALRHLGELEEWCGEPEQAARMRRFSQFIAQGCEQFWNPKRGLYADDLDQSLFSEQTNCLVLLSNLLTSERRAQLEKSLFESEDLICGSIYFSHYLFEAAAAVHRPDIIESRLSPWLELAGQGFVTTPETFGQTRSDCHAWGAHPLYHYYASTLGVTPLTWGFEQVAITPQLGSLEMAQAKMAHPRGEVEVAIRREKDELFGTITLPEGVSGIYVCGNSRLELHAGKQEFQVKISGIFHQIAES